ncbi:MAG: hypothetical protein JWO94_1222 [Verrucomicrobiaceae bacterium]|nr:hypothetical protein [Verrucomicrobiaceae bacterium]
MIVQRYLVLCAVLGVLLAGTARADTPLLAVGDAVPDCELITEQGRVFHLHDHRGQALAVTFIFTRCPLANYCPLMSTHFLAVQRELAKDASAPNWHLLSLSFDPAHDTPATLLGYAKAHGADARAWTFATGKPGAVTDFGAAFGLSAYFKEGLLNHNLRTVVIDARGRVQHVFKGNEWTPQELVWEMRKAMP